MKNRPALLWYRYRLLLLTLGAIVVGSATIYAFAGTPQGVHEEVTMPNIISMHGVYYRIGEPLTDKKVDAVEALFNNTSNKTEKRQLAAFLYRYGRSSGESYLSTLLTRDLDAIAATVFAVNHDKLRKAAILGAFRRASAPDDSFIQALGAWEDREVAEALLEKQSSLPLNGELALALARQNVKAAAPKMRAVHDTMELYNMNEPKFAVAIAKLSPEDSALFDEMSSRMLGKPSKKADGNSLTPDSVAKEMVPSAAYVQEERVIPILTSIVKKSVEGRVKNTVDAEGSPAADDSMLVKAIQALAALKSSESYPLVLDVLDKVSGTDHDTRPHSTQSIIALAIFEMESERSQGQLEAIQGKEWLQRQIGKRALRELPDDLLIFDERLGEKLVTISLGHKPPKVR